MLTYLKQTTNQKQIRPTHKPKIENNMFTQDTNLKNNTKDHTPNTHIKTCQNQHKTHLLRITRVKTKNKTNTHRKTLQKPYHKKPNTHKQDKKLTPPPTTTQTIQKIQTHNPVYHNKNNKNKLIPSTKTYTKYKNVKNTTQYSISN